MSLHNWVPKKIFLTRGTGVNREKLTSFELALREAGIASLNLIKVSSILPPNCEFVDREVGVKLLNPYYDWPLTQYDLKKFVNKKYGSANINVIHHYNDPDGYEVDSDAAGATSVTNWIYEEESNDGKRPIRILQSSMALDVVEEFKSLMKTQ